MENEILEKISCLEKRQAVNNEKIDVANKRIDDLEDETKNNRELIVAVRELTVEVRHMREEQTSMKKEHEVINTRIKNIEDKPLQNYEETKKQIRNYVIVFILGIVCMFFACKLGLQKYI